ncbi:RecQ family ATP-dependent DNA helicase [Neobacillus niacini]|uniref:RecQ family ATP-dependent DNA helicase n=1 Tax=Neobacillus niacini TaxID=86668 RepID=UPI0039837FFA
MKKFTANYCHSNSNFIITNLPNIQIISPYTNIIRIVQNMIMRGNPTIASVFLRKKLNLDRDYLKFMKPVKFLSKENLNWAQTIKGDVQNDDYPAEQFYNDLGRILYSLGFIRNLTIAECPISDIIPEVNQAFTMQKVDFYIPLLKTVIEVDGAGHKRQQELDRKRDKALERFGIKVIRINTKDIRRRNYEDLINHFRELYNTYNYEINQYRHFLEVNPKEYDIQIKLTSIARFQVFVLELLDRGVISIEDKCWNFNIFAVDAKEYLELALRDLELWIGNTAALFNIYIDMPKVNIKVYEREDQIPGNKNDINIKFDLFKRWDDTIKERDVYHIRTDFDDHANYFSVKVKDPVVFKLSANRHQKHLEFFLENLFGFNQFRDGQLEIILNCLNGEDTVGLLPTGGGKSLTYQLCVMLQPAISFVVVPIKSLMYDQIDNLNRKHYITHASYINGDLNPEESSRRLQDFAAGKHFFLVISPERFQSKKFREELSLVNRTKAISLAVIDEVHCLSEWGHEFRTSYLALANSIRKFAPSTRFLALSATASSKVLQDVMNELGINGNNVITISNFTRPELNFSIIPVKQKPKKDYLINYLESNVKKTSKDNEKGATLVFTPTVNGKSGCFELHHYIYSATGLFTGFYSGSKPKQWNGMNSFNDYKDQIQQSFMKDEIDVLVATKAFGMGIDKGNIRTTIHFGIPGSLESFYQEAGRAGRDKTKSNCVVLYNPDQINEEQEQVLFGMNTEVDRLKEETRKVKGDLSTLLFFLTSNLMDIQAEVDEIYKFYHSLPVNEGYEIVIDFYSDIDRERKEKSVYRLALLGIIEDWTIDWKLKKLEVELAEWTEQTVEERLTAHIRKYDSLFTLLSTDRHADQYKDYIEHFSKDNDPFLKRVLYILLKWYNDNVIYSRKRSMLLMKQCADEFTDSQSLQGKIEMYFKRNDDVYFLEKIVAKKDQIKEWFRIFYVQEEGKDDKLRALSTFKGLKVTVSRFLESYNNDISLNLINGMISLAAGEFESLDSRERMESAIRQVSKFESKDRQEMLDSILETSDILLSLEQKTNLSEVLVSNGFNLMDDLRQIYHTFEDPFSFGGMINTLKTKMKQHAYGGYPWES